jgi:hypothetical protein
VVRILKVRGWFVVNVRLSGACIWHTKLKTEQPGLSFSLGCANCQRIGKGGMWGGADKVVEVVGACDSTGTGSDT